MSKPKILQTLDDTRSHIIIQIRSQTQDVLVYKLVQQHEHVKEGHLIGKCQSEIGNNSICATIDGYVVWEGQDAEKLQLSPSSMSQIIGYIYKEQNQSTSLNKMHENGGTHPDLAIIIEDPTIMIAEPRVIEKQFNFSHLGHSAAEYVIVNKWRVSIGDFVYPGQIIGHYLSNVEDNDLICSISGQISYLCKTGEKQSQNQTLVTISDNALQCQHLKVDGQKCLYCGHIIKKTQEDDNNCFPTWQLDEKTQRKLALEVISETVRGQKLIMILDLDQTILHAIRIKSSFKTEEFVEKQNAELIELIKIEKNIDTVDLEDFVNSYTKVSKYIKQFLLEMYCDKESKFIIQLRPYYQQFFLTVLPLFDVYIYTKASRSYAKFILSHLQKELGPHFSNKNLFPENHILSRDDTACHTSKNLNRLFPPNIAHNLMIILDDNVSMWDKFKSNYLPTKPYVFFEESRLKDSQGINCEVESEAKIANKNDFWLLAITKHLKEMSQKFWEQVDTEQKKEPQSNGNGNHHHKLSNLDIINTRNISVQSIYLTYKRKIMAGFSMFFSISKKDSKKMQDYLEDCKKLAFLMGAKIYSEFKENQFQDLKKQLVITNELKPLKSITASQQKGIQIIHYQWIQNCENHLELLDFDPYSFNNNLLQDVQDDQKRDKKNKLQFIQ